VLTALALLSCGGSREPDSEPPAESLQDPGLPTEIAGGQSGSEGGQGITPCFNRPIPVVAGVVTALDGGCATVSDIEVLIGGGVLTSADDGSSLRGVYALFFAREHIEVGQTVYAIYSLGPMGAADSSLQLAVVEDGVVLLKWGSEFYDSSFEELTSEGCRELFLGRSLGEDDDEPNLQEEIPTPLSCAQAP
jgi:hypothetical protein